MPRPPRMLLLGAGLSGGLLALALAELGVEVELAGGSLADSATGSSYGGVPWWAGAANPWDSYWPPHRRWDQLQQRHGDLGLRPAELWLHWSEQAPRRRWPRFSKPWPGCRNSRSSSLSAQEAIAPNLWLEPIWVECCNCPIGVLTLGFQQGLERAWQAAGVRRRAPLRLMNCSSGLARRGGGVVQRCGHAGFAEGYGLQPLRSWPLAGLGCPLRSSPVGC